MADSNTSQQILNETKIFRKQFQIHKSNFFKIRITNSWKKFNKKKKRNKHHY